jgi:hypothetical protein
VSENPVAALRLPPAIFCQPFRLNRDQGSRVMGACPGASDLNVTIGLGLGLDYGRWPKGNGTKPMSWGVSPGYDDYRRWRKNHGHTIWPPNTTSPGVCMNGGGELAVGGWQGAMPDDAGLWRVVCNPFRVGAGVGEVPVAARGLPPAIFCQPFGLNRNETTYGRSGGCGCDRSKALGNRQSILRRQPAGFCHGNWCCTRTGV